MKHMWKNCSKTEQYGELASPECQGWVKDGTEWKIVWEAEEVKKKINSPLTLTKGCSCKTGYNSWPKYFNISHFSEES